VVRPASEVERLIGLAVAEVRKEVPVAEVFLFGSYADGTPHEWSDIDLAIFSPAVDTWDRRKWLDMCYAASKASDFAVEPHFFGMKAKANARPTNFVGYILAHGKRIA
jgi:predicted nucleotidyltransferase